MTAEPVTANVNERRRALRDKHETSCLALNEENVNKEIDPGAALGQGKGSLSRSPSSAAAHPEGMASARTV